MAKGKANTGKMKKYLLFTIPLFLLGSGQAVKDSSKGSLQPGKIETPRQNTEIGKAITARTKAENDEAEQMKIADSTEISNAKTLPIKIK